MRTKQTRECTVHCSNQWPDSFTVDDYKALVKKLYDVDLAKLDRNTFSHVEMDYQGNLK